MNASVMNRSLWTLFVFVAALGLTGCTVNKDTLLAPTDSFISLRSDASFVATNTTTTISIELKKLDGTPAPDGTEVVVQATAGELDQQKVRMRNGSASVQYRSGTATGTARITASSGAITAELSLRVGSAPPGSVTVLTTPLVLPSGGGDAEVLATVSASNGALVAGAPVTFTTSAGTLTTSEVVTNDRGEARTTLRTSTTATVRAAVLGLEAITSIRVRLDVTVRIAATPSEPTAGESTTLSVTLASSDSSATRGRLRFLFGDGQVRDMGNVAGSATTAYTWAKEGGYNVSAEFTDSDGFVTRETIRVNVKAVPVVTPPTPTPNPNPNPTPNPPPGGGGDELDLSKVTFLHNDVSRWRITSKVTDVSISRSEICVDHTGAGRFPTSQFGTIAVEGNVWILAQFNGRWYAATYDWLRPGQVCKGVTGGELGPDQIRIAPMDASWPGPRSGETVGFMVSTRARDDVSAGEERTNVVLVRWP